MPLYEPKNNSHILRLDVYTEGIKMLSKFFARPKALGAFATLTVLFAMFQNMKPLDPEAYYDKELGYCVQEKDGKRIIGARNKRASQTCNSIVGQQLINYKALASTEGSEFLFSQAEKADFSQSLIDGTVFHNSRFNDSTFELAQIIKSEFLDSDLSGTRFLKSKIDETLYKGSEDLLSLRGSNFSEISARDVYFENVDFTNSKFNKAKLFGTTFCGNNNFSGTDLSNANLENISSQNAAKKQRCLDSNLNFSGALLRGASLSFDLKNRAGWCEILGNGQKQKNCAQMKVSFVGADLSGADLSAWPKIIPTDFRNAIYDSTTKLPFNETEARRLQMKKGRN